MRCLDDETLRSYLDGELGHEAHLDIEAHLSSCARCRGTIEYLEDDTLFIDSAINALLKEAGSMDLDTESVWCQLRQKIEPERSPDLKGAWIMNGRFKKYGMAVAALAVALGSLSLAPVRAFASDFLEIFRMNKVEAITVTLEDMDKIRNALTIGQASKSRVNIESFGEIKTDYGNSNKGGERVTLEQAASRAGFHLKFPSGYEKPAIIISDRSTITIKPKVSRINDFIKTLGGTKMLSKALEGRGFTLSVPQDVSIFYDSIKGDAPQIRETQSPEIIAPKGTDVNAIRDALLDIPAVPDNVKNQLKSIDDWKHTMLVTNVGGTSKKVVVNGVEGIFIQQHVEEGGSNGTPYSQLIWNEDGVVFNVSGNFTLDKALDIAGSMK